MSRERFRLALLDAALERAGFDSGSMSLNRYLQRQAGQDMRRRVAACFVALDGKDRIAGYYTLASASLPLDALPSSLAKKLPRYPAVPAIRLGRLAVDLSFKGQGLGGALLADALDRAIRSEIASYALVVDAKDENAAAFYRHHGFIALSDSPMMLFLPLATVRALRKFA